MEVEDLCQMVISIWLLGDSNRATLHESLLGAIPSLFSKETKNSLLFGLGTGITGGMVARLYDQTKIVEINPAMLKVPKHFNRENQNVMTAKNVDIMLEDGISTLFNEDRTYDVIISGVSGPNYLSSKLYSREFYEIARSRLNKGGVFSSWFDVTFGQEGVSIMLNTLKSVFQHCRYFLLNRFYFTVVCSEKPLTYLPSEVVKERVENSNMISQLRHIGVKGEFHEVVRALEVDFGDQFFKKNSQKINTLDFPFIEFMFTKVSDIHHLNKLFNEVIVQSIEQRKSLGVSEWKFKCDVMTRLNGIIYFHLTPCLYPMSLPDSQSESKRSVVNPD